MRVIAMVLIAVAVMRTAQQMAADNAAAELSSAAPSAVSDIDRCRSLTAEQADDARCQHLWAEQRRRFLGQPVASQTP